MGTGFGSGAYFASPPHLQHGLNGIIISHYAKIGKNCWIAQRVTLAQSMHDCTAPTVGDNCVIGVGATLIGDISIGNNVTIAAGAVVTKSFPDNCVIGGVPAKIIRYLPE